MPIPVPTGKDEKHLDMGQCIRALRKEGKPAERRVAICFSVWRRAHDKPEPKEKK